MWKPGRLELATGVVAVALAIIAYMLIDDSSSDPSGSRSSAEAGSETNYKINMQGPSRPALGL